MTARRTFLVAGGVGLCLIVSSPASLAQQKGKVWRIGHLANRGASPSSRNRVAFLAAIRELGYVEGRNLTVEWRGAEDRLERLPTLAAELVKLRVDVIVATSTQATDAARKATASIPIVMVGVGDPVSSGFVKSLSRPGGNITGLSSLTPDLGQKQLELLLSVAPKGARVAVLIDPANSAHEAILTKVREAAQGAGVSIVAAEAGSGAEIAGAIARASHEKAAAILVNGALFNGHLPQIAALAAQHKLASISAFQTFVSAGGLMSYGQNLADNHRRAAAYVDKIFKGANPGDLPVEQPTRFELILNMKTAKALGITFPPATLLQATKVIE